MYVSPVYVDVVRWFDENIPGILEALESMEVYQPEETKEEDGQDDTSYDYEDEQTEDDTTSNEKGNEETNKKTAQKPV